MKTELSMKNLHEVDDGTLANEFDMKLIVAGNIREMPTYRHRDLIIKLKRELHDFDARRKVWK